jgi:hypothetical protein
MLTFPTGVDIAACIVNVAGGFLQCKLFATALRILLRVATLCYLLHFITAYCRQLPRLAGYCLYYLEGILFRVLSWSCLGLVRVTFGSCSERPAGKLSKAPRHDAKVQNMDGMKGDYARI